MSSRALRKAQVLREKQAVENQQDDDESDGEASPGPRSTKGGLFSMLGNADDGVEDDDEDEEIDGNGNGQATDDVKEGDQHQVSLNSQPSRRKKKKKKSKAKAKAKAEQAESVTGTELDDIDRALQSLSTSTGKDPQPSSLTAEDDLTESPEISKLLSINTQHLQVATEMRRLFGRAAFDADRQEARDRRAAMIARAQHSQGREVQLNLGDMVSGAYAAGGPGLSKAIRDRNLFIKGKEEWPRISASGLGMEVVQRLQNGVVEYRFTHDNAYQSVQRNFEGMVSAMDPQLMVDALRFHPYHISTLLQVSEVAKHERDHSTAGDLLERALWSFGRALHPSFAESLAAGKARLDFNRPENREFWLAGWRYIGNIGMRATWRTAHEWAKLLLSLDPTNDPYAIRMCIDRFALRAREPAHFLSLTGSSFGQSWKDQPNITFSRALALKQTSRPEEAEAALKQAIQDSPWVAARFCSSLSIDPIPPSIWGSEPPSNWHALHTELYISSSMDLWRLPDASEFFKSALKSLPSSLPPSPYSSSSTGPTVESDPSLIRHVFLAEQPGLYKFLLPSVFDAPQSQNDPYPPPPSQQLISYETLVPRGREDMFDDVESREHPVTSRLQSDVRDLARRDPTAFIQEMATLQRFFELLFPGLGTNDAATAGDDGGGGGDADGDGGHIDGNGADDGRHQQQEQQQPLPQIDAQRGAALEARAMATRDLNDDAVREIRGLLARLMQMRVFVLRGQGGRFEGPGGMSVAIDSARRLTIDWGERADVEGRRTAEEAESVYSMMMSRRRRRDGGDGGGAGRVPGAYVEDGNDDDEGEHGW